MSRRSVIDGSFYWHPSVWLDAFVQMPHAEAAIQRNFADFPGRFHAGQRFEVRDVPNHPQQRRRPMTNHTPKTSIFRLFVDVTFTLTILGAVAFFGLKKWNPELLAALPGLSVPAPEITDEELDAVAEKPLIPDSAFQPQPQAPETQISTEAEQEFEQPGFEQPEFAQPRFQPQFRQVRQSPCQQSHRPVYRVVYYRGGGCR